LLPGSEERIFDKFYRASPNADAVAKVHGGTITASNGPGGGCEFILRLPLAGNAPKVDLAARLISLAGVRLQLTPLE